MTTQGTLLVMNRNADPVGSLRLYYAAKLEQRSFLMDHSIRRGSEDPEGPILGARIAEPNAVEAHRRDPRWSAGQYDTTSRHGPLIHRIKAKWRRRRNRKMLQKFHGPAVYTARGDRGGNEDDVPVLVPPERSDGAQGAVSPALSPFTRSSSSGLVLHSRVGDLVPVTEDEYRRAPPGTTMFPDPNFSPPAAVPAMNAGTVVDSHGRSLHLSSSNPNSTIGFPLYVDPLIVADTRPKVHPAVKYMAPNPPQAQSSPSRSSQHRRNTPTAMGLEDALAHASTEQVQLADTRPASESSSLKPFVPSTPSDVISERNQRASQATGSSSQPSRSQSMAEIGVFKRMSGATLEGTHTYASSNTATANEEDAEPKKDLLDLASRLRAARLHNQDADPAPTPGPKVVHSPSTVSEPAQPTIRRVENAAAEEQA